jgi:hypothetical protein
MGMVGSASSTDPQNPGWDPEILVSFLSRAICTLDWFTYIRAQSFSLYGENDPTTVNI